MASDDRRTATDELVGEDVEVRGHIIDSLLLPKILDWILQMGGASRSSNARLGARRI